MLRWFFVGQDNDGMADYFTQKLCRHFTVTVIKKGSAYIKGRGENMLISFLPLLKECPARGALGIMLTDEQPPLYLPKNIPFLVSSENEKGLAFLQKRGLCGYSCGLSFKDTFTFSSREENKASVALMRQVRDVYGETLEPMEVVINASEKATDFSLLAYAAAAMLSGLLL